MIIGRRERKRGEILKYINIHEASQQVQNHGQMLQLYENGHDAITGTFGFPPPHLLPGSVSPCATADWVSLLSVRTYTFVHGDSR